MGDTSLSHSASLSTVLCEAPLRNKTSTPGEQSASSPLLLSAGAADAPQDWCSEPAAPSGWKPTASEVCRAEPSSGADSVIDSSQPSPAVPLPSGLQHPRILGCVQHGATQEADVTR